jgi:hypothetical protein
MATTKNGQAQSTTQEMDIGLLANGISGAWRIDVDEATSGPDRWFLQIEGPSAYFHFEIPSLGVIERLGQFLATRPSPNSRQVGPGFQSDWELAIGMDPHAPVLVLRDDEFDDRFFLHIGRSDAVCVRYTFAGDDVKCLAAALEQVREELVAD